MENIAILNTFKNLALIKIEAGKASAVDELRVEMLLADLENKLAYLNDQWVVNTVKFNSLLNVESKTKVDIPDSLWHFDLTEDYNSIIDSLGINNHLIISIEHRIKSFAQQESLAQKNGHPKILLGMDYIGIGNNGINANSGKDALFIKAGISIPMYRKKYSAAIQEAQLMQEAGENQKQDKINALKALFEKTYSNYLDANRRITLYKKQAELAAKAIRILQSEYSSNSLNFEEILRMEKNLLNYELEYQKALADKQASIAFINYLIGK